MDAGREHVRRQDWDQAASSFAQVIDKLPPGFRGASHEMRFCIEIVQTAEVFDRLVKLRPTSRHLWYARGRTYASSREWARAAADIRKSLELLTPLLSESNAEQVLWFDWGEAHYELASILLLAEDQAGYRELCRSVMNAQIPDNGLVLSCVSRTCTMTPDAVADFAKPLQWARYAVEQRPRVAWYLFAQGIAQHRAGQHEEAIKSLNRSLDVNATWAGRGQNFAARALACHSLGRDENARQWLKKALLRLNEMNRAAAGWTFSYAASDFFGDWLCAQVLLREAEILVTGSSVQ
jgi:tetratricopeptide (TPR) repeat protein